MTLRRVAIAGFLAACLPNLGMAQDRLAYVIGNARFGGPALAQPTKDALAMSRALIGLGFDVVRRQNTTAAELVLGKRAARTVALYYSGRTEATEDGDVLLRGAQLGDAPSSGWPILKTIRAFREAGAEEVIVFVETCQADDDSLSQLEEEQPEDGVVITLSHDPSLGCEAVEAETTAADETETAADSSETEENNRFTDRVLLALATPDTPFAEAFEAATGPGWLRPGAPTSIVVWPQGEDSGGGTSLPDNALTLLETLPEGEQARMRSLWQSAGLINAEGEIVSRVATRPATTVLVAPEATSSGVTIVGAAVSPVIPKSAPGGVRITSRINSAEPTNVSRSTRADNGVQIFNPVVRTDAPDAVATAAGLPEPYIIVGEIRATNASFDATETGNLTGTSLDTSDFEVRNQLRNSDPDNYIQLVGSGAFDPTDTSNRGLSRAIQTELARMRCYTSGIDGIWGRGSEGSVRRYFEQIEETPAGVAPTLDLFRKIILKDDVSCPVVRQAATPSRNTGTTTTRRNTGTTTRQQPAARRQPAQPARRPATSSGGINPNTLGTGVFR